MEHMTDTLQYYDKNAEKFVQTTRKVDFSETQNVFLENITPGGAILDLGCGSGRDAKAFLEKGYHVTAIDGSKELCRLASRYLGIPVRQMLFQELEDKECYDGIWACSSILHLSYEELKKVLLKIADALKTKGIFYTSFKYGTFEGSRNGRYFTDMTLEKMEQLLEETNCFVMKKMWITKDVRPERGDESWLNIILGKK